MNHRQTRTPLKAHGEIIASIGENTLNEEPETEVRIHHLAGMTITLDRNEALALLEFLIDHKQALLGAIDPEAL